MVYERVYGVWEGVWCMGGCTVYSGGMVRIFALVQPLITVLRLRLYYRLMFFFSLLLVATIHDSL
jgi:hypothetical protein